MPELRFEWDAGKARANVQKHGVSFEEAETVFVDEHALLLDDPDHSATEDRFVLVGLSSRFRVLVVVHTYRERDAIIRLISARKATTAERAVYDGEVECMRREYDFSNARPNPYVERLKQSVTIRLDSRALEYFKDLSTRTGIAYQTLINLYLRDCAMTGRKLELRWKPAKPARLTKRLKVPRARK